MIKRLHWFIPRRFFGFKNIQKFNPHPSLPEPFAYPQPVPGTDDDIIVAMSSGVDSSVTAALYASKYKNVKGIYMANWSQSAKCTEGEWSDVQRVCEQLNIPCQRVNFEKEYWNEVFMPMIDLYEKGLTPNPDLGCNKYVKFGKMLEHLSLQYTHTTTKWWLATGHYARVVPDAKGARLLKGYDANKDQAYYLANIPAGVLSNVLMPLGHYTKPQVREMAREFGLHTATKPDSQGLCFVSPEHSKFRDFLNEFIPPNPGNIVTEDGNIWGQHQGLWHATIGQKLGVSMPQGDPRYKGIWFVSEKRIDTNELVIVRGGNNDKLLKDGLKVSQWEWMGDGGESVEDFKLGDKSPQLVVQFRSLQDPAVVESIHIDGDNLTIQLTEKQRAMAPGQNVVLYDSYRVVGSGLLVDTFDKRTHVNSQ